jgi:ATP-dependent DNA helicase PIF1
MSSRQRATQQLQVVRNLRQNASGTALGFHQSATRGLVTNAFLSGVNPYGRRSLAPGDAGIDVYEGGEAIARRYRSGGHVYYVSYLQVIPGSTFSTRGPAGGYAAAAIAANQGRVDTAAGRASVARAMQQVLLSTLDRIGTQGLPPLSAANPLHVRFRMEASISVPSGMHYRTRYVNYTANNPSALTSGNLSTQLQTVINNDQIAGSDYAASMSAYDAHNADYRIRAVGVEFMRRDGGGCGGKDRYSSAASDREGFFFLLDNPSCEDHTNDCGIRCFMAGMSYAGVDLPKGCRKADAIRRRCSLEPLVALSYHDLDEVANLLGCGYQVYTFNHGDLSHVAHEHAGSPMFRLFHAYGHYTLVLRYIGKCSCGSPALPDHVCTEGKSACATCGLMVTGGVHRCPWEAEMVGNRLRAKRVLEEATREAAERKKARVDEISSLSIDNSNEALDRILDNIFVKKVSVQFLIGQGGTGKTWTIDKVVDHAKKIRDYDVRVVTSTGAAATLIEGATTIHNLCRLGTARGTGDMWAQRLLHEKEGDESTVETIQGIDLLIVDEISMLQGRSFFDQLDSMFRIIRNEPMVAFGGIQLLLVGDSLQLPPVSLVDDYRDFFFDAEVFDRIPEGAVASEVLCEPKRYPDPAWFALLARVRRGAMTKADREMLDTRRVNMAFIDEKNNHRGCPILLIASTHKVVDAYNRSQMRSVAGGSAVYVARDVRPQEGVDYGRIAPARIEVKIGCVVMLTVNHGSGDGSYLDDHGVGNGSRGVVVDFSRPEETETWVDVQFNKTGEVVRIKPNQYLERFKSGMSGRIQMPLILAWAITIHRAQGCSIREECALDLSNLFENHMAYTALSRVSRMELLWIVNSGPIQIRVNDRCLRFADSDDLPPVGVVQDCVGRFISNTLTDVQTETLKNFSCKRPSTQRTSVVSSMIDQKSLIINAVLCEGSSIRDSRSEMTIVAVDVLWLRSGMDDEVVRFRKRRDDHDVVQEFFDWLFQLLEADADEHDQLADQKNCARKAWVKLPYRVCVSSDHGFDFSFFLQHIFYSGMSRRFNTTQVFKGTKLVYLNLRDMWTNKECMVVHSICQVLDCTVEKAFQKFIERPPEESVFPVKRLSRADAYDLLRSDVPASFGREDFCARDLTLIDSKKTFSERQELFNRSFPGSDMHVHFDQESFDCVTGVTLGAAFAGWSQRHLSGMRQLYRSIDTLLDPIIGGTSVLNFNTANSVSVFGIMTHLPPECTFATGTYQEVQSRIYRLPGDMMDFVGESIMGGKTSVACDRFESKDIGKKIDVTQSDWYKTTDALVYFDVNSMYPSDMLRDYPFGRPYWGVFKDLDRIAQIICDPGRWEELNDMCFVARVDVRGHLRDVVPTVVHRTEHGSAWDSKFGEGKVLTSWDIYTVLQNRGSVDSIQAVLIWPHKGPIYKRWIEKCIRLKEEGVREGNLPKRQLGKLLANCAFGSSLKGNYFFTSSICTTKEHFDRFFAKAEWEGTYAYREGLCLWGQAKVAPEDRYSNSGMQGTFILAATRQSRSSFYRRLLGESQFQPPEPENPIWFYEDTDSCIFHCKYLDRVLPLLGAGLGEWSDEIYPEWDQRAESPGLVMPGLITRLYVAGPKAYAFQGHAPQGTEGRALPVLYDLGKVDKEVSKWKGVSGDPHALFEADGIEMETGLDITVFEGLFRRDVCDEDAEGDDAGDNDNGFSVHTKTMKRMPAWCMSYEDKSFGCCPFSVSTDTRTVSVSLNPYLSKKPYIVRQLKDGTLQTTYVPLSFPIGL